MPKIDLFSNRNRKDNRNGNDIFRYDILPIEFRNQVVLILEEIQHKIFTSEYMENEIEKFYKLINKSLCKEFGRLDLVKITNMYDFSTARNEIRKFIRSEENYEFVLSAIELTFRELNYLTENYYYSFVSVLKDATTELNVRFLEHNLGYQYESGQIIRIDSKILHEDVTKPTLIVLSDEIYQGANEEFLSAHNHYKNGNYKECLVDCLKSFESTMKIICTKHGWTFKQDKDTASKLIDICFENKLIPDYLQSQFGTLKTNLQCGIPTVRNKESSHGQGDKIRTVPPYLAAYLLHLTATSILLLTDAEKELK